MNIGGYGVREHIKLLAPAYGLIAAVWLLRWVLDALGAPRVLVVGLSVSGATALAILIAVGLIHFRSVGGYSSVLLASFLIVVWEQTLIVAAILVSVLSGVENVFTEPEFSIGNDPNHVRHIVGHLTFGIAAGMLFGGAAGCVLLFLLRRLVPSRERSV
jgi:hypothetical protein